MVVKNVQITVLIEDCNSSSKPHLKAKHSLAYFIKTKTEDGEVTIMMDTGQLQKSFYTTWMKWT